MLLSKRLWALLPLFVLPGLCTFTSSSAQAQNRFAQAPLYPTGGAGNAAATADFNGDGRADLLTVGLYNPTPSTSAMGVFLNVANAGGSYAAPKELFQVGLRDYALLATGDFNGDGKQDFAVALSPENVIHVYAGNGNATFQAPQTITFSAAADNLPVSFLAGKINNDSHIDLVLGMTANNNSAGVFDVFLGHGDGTFAAAKTTAVNVTPNSTALADVNLDGNLDLSFIDESNSYQTVLGHGDGTFTLKPSVFLPGYGGYRQVVVTDFTGDGKPDLVLANIGDWINYTGTGEIPSLFVLTGYGDGTFNNTGTLYDSGNAGLSVAVGDLSNDGHPEVVVYNVLSSTIGVRYGSSSGMTSAYTAKYAVGSISTGLLLADANGDGRLDVLLVGGGGVQVLLNVGGGNLRAPKATDMQTYTFEVQAADLNHDGYADLALMGNDVGSRDVGTGFELLYLALGNRSQSLTPVGTGVYGDFDTSTGRPDPLGLGNFNADGNLDVLTGSGVAFNTGGAHFTAPTSQPSNIAFGFKTAANYGTVAGDLNHDGKADLVSAGSTSITVTLGNGDGTFQAPVTYSLGGTNANAVLLRDMNKDGNLDAVTVNNGTSTASVFLGNGDGTFKAAREFPVTAGPLVATTSDFNRDGKLDIAVASANHVSILLGDGTGNFTGGATVAVGAGLDGIVASDLRGNGVFDLILADGTNNTVYVLYGTGTGSLGTPVPYAVGASPTAIAAGDFNADGAPDVAVALKTSSAVPVFYNQGGTHVSLTASNTSPAAGQAVTFHASVGASLPGNPTPTGTVAFKQGTTILAKVALSGGNASYTTSTLSKGSHTIVAVYYGSSTFNPHSSGAVTVTVH